MAINTKLGCVLFGAVTATEVDDNRATVMTAHTPDLFAILDHGA